MYLGETAKEQTRELAEGEGGEPPTMELMTYGGNLARAAREEGFAYPLNDL